LQFKTLRSQIATLIEVEMGNESTWRRFCSHIVLICNEAFPLTPGNKFALEINDDE
jgi:hypothetical protein